MNQEYNENFFLNAIIDFNLIIFCRGVNLFKKKKYTQNYLINSLDFFEIFKTIKKLFF
jgi:hypothetical protein